LKAEERKEEERERRAQLRKKMKMQSNLDDTPDKVLHTLPTDLRSR